MPLTNIQALRALGFNEKDKPTTDQLRAAYRKKALLTHPDKIIYPANATEEQKKQLLGKQTKAFQLVSEAYQTLNNPAPHPTLRRSAQPSTNVKEFTIEDAIALFNSLSRKEQIGVIVVGAAVTLLYSAYHYFTQPSTRPVLNAKRETTENVSQHQKRRRV